MRNQFSSITRCGIVLAVLLSMTAGVQAQDGPDLVRQLTGKAEVPARDVAQLAQAYRSAINYLLPLMSADDVPSRYNYQIMLQDMGSHAARPGAETERRTLAEAIIETLDRASMPETVRHWFVLQLERIGKGESVPALTRLMSSDDAHLRDYARRALEQNPDPAATEALLKELTSTKDATWKIGLIESLGQRRVEEAIDPIAAVLADSDPAMASAAATALANIGGLESAKALFGVLNKPWGPVSMKAAEALIDIAHERAAHNDVVNAGKLYVAVYNWATKLTRDSDSPNPFGIRAAAINGLMVCDPGKAGPEIVNIIRDGDPRVARIAVQVARQAPTKDAMRALSRVLPELPPAYQVQVLGLIADRGDLSSVGPVKSVLNSEFETVRLAAIETLTQVGSDASAETLLEITLKGSGSVQRAARDGLARMAGPRVDEVIAARAASGEVKGRSAAIGLLGKRRVPGAVDVLLSYAADGNEEIRSAAFRAMVDVADAVDPATLADLVATTTGQSARSSAGAALRAVLTKAPDKAGAAQAVLERLRTTDGDSKITLLGCLDAAGGPAALDAVARAAQSSDEALREVGIRTLGNWPDFEAADILLTIASKSETSLTHYVLAVRGALRLIVTSDSAPLDERVALCLRAFDIARRDDEKRPVIAAMGALPSPKLAEHLLALAKDGSFKTEAALAAVELAGNMLRSDREAARDLAQKIRDLNVSNDVNNRAEAVLRGRPIRGRGR
jgi:HEAT repeat protein